MDSFEVICKSAVPAKNGAPVIVCITCIEEIAKAVTELLNYGHEIPVAEYYSVSAKTDKDEEKI